MEYYLKIAYEGNVKRSKWVAPEANVFDSMVNTIERIFPEVSDNIRDPKLLRITYLDEESCDITLDSEEAVNVFLEETLSRFNVANGRPILLSIKIHHVKEASPSSEKIFREVGGGLVKVLSSFASNDPNSISKSKAEISKMMNAMPGAISSMMPEQTNNNSDGQCRYPPNNRGLKREGHCNMRGNQRPGPHKFRGGPNLNRCPEGPPAAHRVNTPRMAKCPVPEPHPQPDNLPNDLGSVIHYGTVCDKCDEVIIGIRYKSAVLEDYDLCEKCESGPAGKENVPYLKIYHPFQCPDLLICGINGEVTGNCARRRWHRGPGRQGRGCRKFRRGQQMSDNPTTPDDSEELQKIIEESMKKESKMGDNSEIKEEEEKIANEDLLSAPELKDDSTGNEERKGPQLIYTKPKVRFTNDEEKKDSLSGDYEILDIAEKTENIKIGDTSENIENDEDLEKRKRAKYWEKELTQLAAIGFTDFKRNMDLLDKFVEESGKGGLEKVLNALIDE